MRGRVGAGAVLAVSLCVVAWLALAGSASAQTSVFCTNSSSDQASLQSAIDGGGTVVVHGTCLGNWTVSNQVTLTGAGGAALAGAGGGSVLDVESFAPVTINTLTIRNGGEDVGGGVYAGPESTVFVNNSRLTGNGADDGGGLYADALSYVALTGTVVSGNFAYDGGGGIAAFAAWVTLTNSTVSGNTAGVADQEAGFGGGGIAAQYASVSLTGSKVSGNLATGLEYADGGGIAFEDGAALEQGIGGGALPTSRPALTVRGRTFRFRDLSSGRAVPKTVRPFQQELVFPPLGLTLTSSTVDHNQVTGDYGAGGGIENDTYDFDSPVTITNSQVTNNNAPGYDAGGGGLFNFGGFGLTAQVTAAGSQFRGNKALAGGGGAIDNWGVEEGAGLVSLSSTTISSAFGSLNPNQAANGGGIYNTQYNDGIGDVTVQNKSSIVRNKASSAGGGVYNDCAATYTQTSGAIVMLNAPNNVITSTGPFDVVGDACNGV
jgi:fibronectin-binding autotransporter adhesin